MLRLEIVSDIFLYLSSQEYAQSNSVFHSGLLLANRNANTPLALLLEKAISIIFCLIASSATCSYNSVICYAPWDERQSYGALSS